MTNELIEQIGGRERLEAIVYAMGAEPCDADPILDSVTHVDIGKMARALLSVLDVQAATHECNDSPFKKVEIVWLGKCRCGNKVHTASTIKGGCDRLYDDDEVTCNACGRRGVIQCCEGYAGVLWETELERTTTPAASAPDGWKLVPIEPTEEMNRAGWEAMNSHDAINPTYSAMLEAAPAPGGE